MEEDPRPPFLDFDEWLPTQCHVLQPLIPRLLLRLSTPDEISPPGLTGGEGDEVPQHITCTQDLIAIRITLADLALLNSSALTRTVLLEHLPIRLSTRCTRAQSRATPSDEYCGLHALLRLIKSMGPEEKQKRDLPALQQLTTDFLLPRAQSDDWPLESVVPHLTREYLNRALQGTKIADSVDHMPIEAMRLLVHRHPSMTALWITDRNASDELWLTTIAGLALALTMAHLLRKHGDEAV